MSGISRRFLGLSRFGSLISHPPKTRQLPHAVTYQNDTNNTSVMTHNSQSGNNPLNKHQKIIVNSTLSTVRNFSSRQKDSNIKEGESNTCNNINYSLEGLLDDYKNICTFLYYDYCKKPSLDLEYYLNITYSNILITTFIKSLLGYSKEDILLDKNSKIGDGFNSTTLNAFQLYVSLNLFNHIEYIFTGGIRKNENLCKFVLSPGFIFREILIDIELIECPEVRIFLLDHICSKIKNDKNEKFRYIIKILKKINEA